MSIRLCLSVLGGARGGAVRMARRLSGLVPRISNEARKRLEELTNGVGVTGYETLAELRERVDFEKFQRLHVEDFDSFRRDPQVREVFGTSEKMVRAAYERFCRAQFECFLYRARLRDLVE